MSWIRNTCWFALASLALLSPAIAQVPQLAPPQYGLPEAAPRGFADQGPQPNLATPPLASPAANDDSREYLRLLNQPAATASPASTSTSAGNPTLVNPPAMNSLNVAARPEPATSPNNQAIYQQPVAATGSPSAQPLNGISPNAAAPNAAPTNIPATYVAPINNTVNNAPRTINTTGAKPLPLAGPNAKTPAAASSWGSFGTMLGSLAIVLGLFVVTIKLLRRGMPGGKQRLGREVVEVLGQTPLANRQSLQVIRFGNKILLVAMSPDGCDTLTEITDPLEVDRVAGMCQQSQASSSTKSFGEMFRQVTSIRPAVSEPADEPPATSSTLDEVRTRLRGGSLSAKEVQHG